MKTRAKFCLRFADLTEPGKLDHNTYLVRLDQDTWAVQFWTTYILLIHRDGSYTYRHGGHQSRTVLGRLNRYGPLTITKGRNDNWYYTLNGEIHDFVEGMRIIRS